MLCYHMDLDIHNTCTKKIETTLKSLHVHIMLLYLHYTDMNHQGRMDLDCTPRCIDIHIML